MTHIIDKEHIIKRTHQDKEIVITGYNCSYIQFRNKESEFRTGLSLKNIDLSHP